MRTAVQYVLVQGILLLPARALACAVCVDGSKLDLGFLWSAVFLIAVPFVMAGLIGGWLYYASRNGRGLAVGDNPRRWFLARRRWVRGGAPSVNRGG
jgi:hypothetical protein